MEASGTSSPISPVIAPEHAPGKITAPEHSPGKITAPEHSPGKITAPEHPPEKIIAPEHPPETITAPEHTPRKITKAVMLFFGGADDREALSLAARIGGHSHVELTVVRFLPSEAWALELQRRSKLRTGSFSEKRGLISKRASLGDSSAEPPQGQNGTEGKRPVVIPESDGAPNGDQEQVRESPELARRTNLTSDDERAPSTSSEASSVSVVVDRLQPDRERALDEAALAFLYAEVKRDHSEGRPVKATFQNVELDEQSVWTAVKVSRGLLY
jgi:hypothetical protein